MKLTNNISIYLFLVLSSSIILADDLSGLNQTSDSPIIQTDPNYSLSPTPEYYNDIIDSEQNGINNPDKSENHRNQDGKHNISDDNDSNNSEIISMSTNGQTVSNFYYTGAMQTYVVPAGVNSITIEAWGAEGGESDGSGTHGLIQAGQGGYATGELSVTSGQILYIYVGGQGNINETYQSISAGGWNGGGDGWGGWSSNYSIGNGTSGGGGGASDVRVGGTTLNDRIIVAGGGGGSDSWATTRWGGDGGGLTGSISGGGATGGTQSAGGASNHNNATDGSFGQGGDGYSSESEGHGTGGGGGYYGGGGGQHSGAGGGGGSSYIGGVTNGSTISGGRDGNGLIVITAPETMPDPITSIDITGTSGYRMLSSPVAGAIYDNFLDELYTQGMTGSDNPDVGQPNVWTWNNSWDALTDLTTDNYTAGSGVLVYVFSDTDFDGDDDLPVTLSVASQEDCGGYSYSDYDMNSGNQGNMWDVVAVNPITITSVGFNFNGCAGSSQTIRLYKRIDFGTHADVEFNSSAWEVIFDGTISCSGWAPTSTITGIDVFIPQGERQAFYLHGVSRGLVADWQAGEVGDLHYSNEDLEVYVGSPLPGYFDDGYSGASAAPSMGMGYCIGSNSDGWTDYDSPVSISTNDVSWNLLGNPYAYSLSIQQLAIDNSGHGPVYIWDSAADAYKNHNGIAGDIADGLIAPFQGFFSEATAGATSYTFTESSISYDAGTNYRTTTDESSGSAVFTFTNGGYSSSTYLSFTAEGQINLDQADANRLVPLSPAEHLTSMIHESGKSLSINNLPYDLSADISFPMDVMMLSPTDDGYATQAEQVNLTWDITNLPEGITLMLRNNITGQNINLTGYPSATITLPSKGSFSTSGDFMATYPVVGDAYFTVSVNATLAGQGDDDITLPEKLVLHNAYPNPFNPSTLIRFDLLDANMVSLDIFDLNGKQVSSLISEYMIPGSHQISWNPGNLSSGVYIAKLSAGNTSLNQKITYIK